MLINTQTEKLFGYKREELLGQPVEVLVPERFWHHHAENLQKALEMSEANQPHIDLLVTDVVLPRASGPKLTDRLAATRQDMKVRFVSGYTADALVHGDLHRTDFAFLPNRFH